MVCANVARRTPPLFVLAAVSLLSLPFCGNNGGVASAFLTRGSDAPDLSGYVRHSARVLYPLWGALPAAVVDGSHQWHSAFAHLGGADV